MATTRPLWNSVVLVSMMQHGVTEGRLERLNESIHVGRRTVAAPVAMVAEFWRNARASFSPPVEQGRLLATLFERFHSEAVERLIALLRYISPITGGKARAF
jgi:hypothetical protein